MAVLPWDAIRTATQAFKRKRKTATRMGSSDMVIVTSSQRLRFTLFLEI
jgi:hypothetical protein